MSEMDPRDAEIDGLLRRSMAAPVPNLPGDFEHRLIGELRRRSERLERWRRVLLGGYGVTSVFVSAAAMLEQGLDWGTISATIFAPLVLVAGAVLVKRRAETRVMRGR